MDNDVRKTIALSPRQCADVELLRVGGYRPLEGFMCESAYRSVLHHMHLPDGEPWPMPITLAMGPDGGEHNIAEGDHVDLLDGVGRRVGTIHVQQRFGYDKEAEATAVFRTTDEAHPGVAALYAQPDELIGGPVSFDGVASVGDDPRHLSPADLQKSFADRGWRTVVGFQTRNPIHRAHEYIQKTALEIVDGLLIHPLVGVTKEDDVPADVRWECYEVLMNGYFPSNRVILSALPAAMRYAGPREAVFHALIRRNYGCTHFIVGRDHAGVGDYYGSYDAQEIFKEFDRGELGIEPLFFEHAFWCTSCSGMGTAKTCPHDAAQHVFLSGTRLRALLNEGRQAPPEFTRPEVAEVLAAAYTAN